MNLSDMNYAGDPRVTCGEAKPPVLVEGEDGEIERELPWRWGVCPICDGKGTHVNPAIDAGGITGAEMDELGPDFQEDYLSGVYDVPCNLCGGRTTVPVLDEARCPKEDVEAYRRQEAERAQARRDEARAWAMGY